MVNIISALLGLVTIALVGQLSAIAQSEYMHYIIETDIQKHGMQAVIVDMFNYHLTQRTIEATFSTASIVFGGLCVLDCGRVLKRMLYADS